MPEPWLQLSSNYLIEESIRVSAQDYRRFLQQQYQNLPISLKEMMSFDYFEQQSEAKRAEIESSLIAQQRQSEGTKPFPAESLQDWRVLAMFEHWQDMPLWQSMAAEGQGLVVEFDVVQSGFRTETYNDQIQHLGKVLQVKSWAPESDLYYLFNRPEESRLNQHEWRLIRKITAADRRIEVQGIERAMYRLPTKAVKRVILGYRCSPEYCQEVKQYLSQDINYRHTECMQAQLDPRTLCLQRVVI